MSDRKTDARGFYRLSVIRVRISTLATVAWEFKVSTLATVLKKKSRRTHAQHYFILSLCILIISCCRADDGNHSTPNGQESGDDTASLPTVGTYPARSFYVEPRHSDIKPPTSDQWVSESPDGRRSEAGEGLQRRLELFPEPRRARYYVI
ncbi:hypothetical protein EVAR_22677_1 [Eumeta japonica]|uniref:Uncharacterized protein n=1 Tax=Eumeta variegata TaxID=151549 RepID=A0A4C1VL78_EUMVA|nr:hypothetical protein EVAR_22677_1 [Eumeta japonica]